MIISLNSDEYRIGGSNHTVSPYSYGAGFKVNHGASERHIFNTANWDESLTVIPAGASGVPATEFYTVITSLSFISITLSILLLKELVIC